MLTFEIKAFSNADRNMLGCERQTAGCVSDTTTRALQAPGSASCVVQRSCCI